MHTGLPVAGQSGSHMFDFVPGTGYRGMCDITLPSRSLCRALEHVSVYHIFGVVRCYWLSSAAVWRESVYRLMWLGATEIPRYSGVGWVRGIEVITLQCLGLWPSYVAICLHVVSFEGPGCLTAWFDRISASGVRLHGPLQHVRSICRSLTANAELPTTNPIRIV